MPEDPPVWEPLVLGVLMQQLLGQLRLQVRLQSLSYSPCFLQPQSAAFCQLHKHMLSYPHTLIGYMSTTTKCSGHLPWYAGPGGTLGGCGAIGLVLGTVRRGTVRRQQGHPNQALAAGEWEPAQAGLRGRACVLR